MNFGFICDFLNHSNKNHRFEVREDLTSHGVEPESRDHVFNPRVTLELNLVRFLQDTTMVQTHNQSQISVQKQLQPMKSQKAGRIASLFFEANNPWIQIGFFS